MRVLSRMWQMLLKGIAEVQPATRPAAAAEMVLVRIAYVADLPTPDEAIRMLEDGVSDAAAIDRAMELGYRNPMGPLRLTDLVGLDVRLHIAEYLAQELGPRFEPPALLREKVAAGELGRKSGRGFHDWS